jgi:hypothetical protein
MLYNLIFEIKKPVGRLTIPDQGQVVKALNNLSIRPNRWEVRYDSMILGVSIEAKDEVESRESATEYAREIGEKVPLKELGLVLLEDYDLKVSKKPDSEELKTFRVMFVNGGMVDVKAERFTFERSHQAYFYANGGTVASFDSHFILGISDLDVLSIQNVKLLLNSPEAIEDAVVEDEDGSGDDDESEEDESDDDTSSSRQE